MWELHNSTPLAWNFDKVCDAYLIYKSPHVRHAVMVIHHLVVL